MRYPFKSTGRPISHRNEWSFRVYMLPLRNFVPEWYSRSGTTTGVNSRRCDSRWYGILCWYHVNKYRATRGNRNELAPARKSPRCHVNTPWNTFYCENGRQASQRRGFTKRNIRPSPHDPGHFLKRIVCYPYSFGRGPANHSGERFQRMRFRWVGFSSFVWWKVDSCKRYAVARISGFVWTRPKSVTNKVRGHCLEMTKHSSEKSLKHS